MVVTAVHTYEQEEANAWTWGVGSSISTPEVSFPGSPSNNIVSVVVIWACL